MKKLLKRLQRHLSARQGREFSLDRMVGKSFVRPDQLPHRQLLELMASHGRNGFDVRETDYFRKIADFSGNLADNFGSLPALDVPPTWWLMPWAESTRKGTVLPREMRERKAQESIRRLFDLHDSIVAHGYVSGKGGAIDGYLLEHPERGQVFNHIDGHHRIAVLDFLRARGQVPIDQVRVNVLAVVRRTSLLEQAPCRHGVQRGVFSERDAFALFDHLFDVVERRLD